MKFKEFTKFLDKVEKTASRNDVTIIISELFGELAEYEVANAMYLMMGRLAPKFEDVEFNVARKILLQALEEISEAQEVKNLFREKGDIGLVAEQVALKKFDISTSPNGLGLFEEEKLFVDKELEINQVYTTLFEMAQLEGQGSVGHRKTKFIELISNLDPLSSRYVSRIIVGSLRLGVSDKTILDSLSWYISKDKTNRKLLDLAYGARADIGYIAHLVVSSADPINKLSEINIEAGVPVASKLVERESSSAGVWERMPNCFVQPKLDGLRGQIHKSEGGEIKIFSRNMENMTHQFPEIVKAVRELNVTSIILDSEIIGFDTANGNYLSYQETMQRKRKYDVESFSEQVPVKAMCFDILYLNGQDISQTPIEDRMTKLDEILKINESINLEKLETIQTQSENELDTYFELKVADGLEGIITKEVGSAYDPGTRNYSWIKLKANTKSELVDTIDVTVIGYYIGRGQRAKHGIGAFLTAAYDPEEDKYYSIGKVGSGITDDIFGQIVKDIEELKVNDKPQNVEVEKSLYPDTWLRPEIVIEIVADEITRSPNHSAARGMKTNVPKDDASRGLSIRFPRMKIWNRDKDLPNTVGEIVRMYELRKGGNKH